MKNAKRESAVALSLCALLWGMTGCNKGSGDGVAARSALISNGVDDDQDGETDESDEACGAQDQEGDDAEDEDGDDGDVEDGDDEDGETDEGEEDGEDEHGEEEEDDDDVEECE